MALLRSRRGFLAACAAFVSLTAATAPGALAQPAWKPDRPITFIVPYSPGGGTDALARFVAKDLQRRFGQTVNVENYPGADGLIGTRRAIDAKPDGYTFLVQLPSLLLNRHLPGFKGTDPVSQLVPVSAFAVLSGVYVVNTAIPGNTLGEVIAHCRTATTPCTFGTTENTARLRLQMLQETLLPSMIVVNYKGGGQLVTDLVGNNVNVGSMGYTAVIPHMKTGHLKVVMTSGTRRSPVIPEVPTSIESGFPQLTGETWYGLFAPLGTPRPIVDAVSAAVRDVARDEAVVKSFASLGASPIGNTPEEFVQLIRDEDGRLSDLVKRFPLQ